jgi:hypothetical protein
MLTNSERSIHMKVTQKVSVLDEVDASELLTGTIVYESLPYEERTAKYNETMKGIRTGEDGDHTDDIELSKRYFNILKDVKAEVACKLADGTEIKTIDEMYEYQEGIAVCNSLALKVITAQRLGKKKLN